MRADWIKLVPEAYKAMRCMEDFAEDTGLEPKLIELVKIRASQINGCAYCLDMHTKDAAAIGETDQRMYVLSAWREAPFYSPRERAALVWCESLTLLPETNAPDEAYEEVSKVFSTEEIIKLTFVIVTINCWNRFAVGFRTEAGRYISRRVPASQ